MAHNIEMIDGKAQMAYSGELPWHGLGTKVPPDLTSDQMMDAAGLNWTVRKIPAFAKVGDKNVDVGRSALVRNTDDKILDIVSNDWNPVQNQEAFEFFNDFIAASEMEMHTAGSLKDGKIVWALAKVKESFTLFKHDKVDSYMLFSNFHQYGFSTDIRFTPIRVVCNNTLSLSLSSDVDRQVKFNHRRKFEPDLAKLLLGIAADKLKKYKEMAAFLGSKKAKDEDVVEYFKRIFPVTSVKEGTDPKKEYSRNAGIAMDTMETQPGHEFAPGTWWPVYNSVTFMTDHIVGRSNDTRMASSWYGVNKNLKVKALELAVEMADAS